MANNPNPQRITPALWYFAEGCLALHPGTRNGGIVAQQPGYHCWRDWLVNNRPNDYSIRYGPDKLGPGDKSAAFDWTFPDAQRGAYGTIIRYGERVRAAHQSRDERAYGFREVLIQADWDNDAEGYDFYLGSVRTPDSSHLWHGHFSVLRQFLNDMRAMQGMLSILAGESLATWRAGGSRYGGTGTGDDMTPDENRRLFNVDEGYLSSVIDLRDTAQIAPYGSTPNDPKATVQNKLAQAVKAIKLDVAEIKEAMETPVSVSVDASDVAAILETSEVLQEAIAEKVAAKLAARLQS